MHFKGSHVEVQLDPERVTSVGLNGGGAAINTVFKM